MSYLREIAQKWRGLTLNLDFALDFPSFCSQGQLLSATDSGTSAHRVSSSVLAPFIAVSISSRSRVCAAQLQSPVKSVPSKGCCRPSDSSSVACTAISAEVLLLFRDPGPPVSRPLHFLRACVFPEAPAIGTTRFRLCHAFLLLCDALRLSRGLLISLPFA